MTDTNTALIPVDTAVANINPVELMARFEPEQQLQLFKIQQSIFLQNQKRQTALELENYRSRNSWMLNERKHQNELAQIKYQADREEQQTALKAQVTVALADKAHSNQLEQMQLELQNKMAFAEFTTGLSVVTMLMEEDSKVRTSILARMANSHAVREEKSKMLYEAVIHEKRVQKQHLRDLEKMQFASSLKQSEQYFQSICLRLSRLLDEGKTDKVQEEIDQLCAKWEKEEDESI